MSSCWSITPCRFQHSNGHNRSVIVELAAYLDATESITVGGQVISPIGLRRQPVDVALDLATLALLHPGRVALTAGTGGSNERPPNGPESGQFLVSISRRKPRSRSPARPPSGTTIEKTRERGYSLNLEETTVGVCSLGFAVRLGSNLEMVALSITGPAHRWTPEAIGEIAPDLLKRVTARSPLTPAEPS